MELKLNGQVFQFKEELSMNDFIEVGIPPKELFEMDKDTKDLTAFKPIFAYLRGLFNATKLKPELDPGRDIPVAAVMKQLISDPTQIMDWIMKGLLGISDLNK